MRWWAIVTLLAAALAACGGSAGAFGDVSVSLGAAKPDANDVGLYFAQARGYDEAEGVTFKIAAAGGHPDLSIVSAAELARRPDLVGVMAIVRPAKLVVAAPRDSLGEDKDMIEAAIRALQRGYLQAQLEPDEAVAAMVTAVPGLDTGAVSSQLDEVAPTWSQGGFLGELPAGREYDRSLVHPQAANQ